MRVTKSLCLWYVEEFGYLAHTFATGIKLYSSLHSCTCISLETNIAVIDLHALLCGIVIVYNEPAERSRHSTVVIEDYLYLWGGWQKNLPKAHSNDEKERLTSHVHAFHCKLGEWVRNNSYSLFVCVLIYCSHQLWAFDVFAGGHAMVPLVILPLECLTMRVPP